VAKVPASDGSVAMARKAMYGVGRGRGRQGGRQTSGVPGYSCDLSKAQPIADTSRRSWPISQLTLVVVIPASATQTVRR
jgi:hypothetical protein